MENREIAETFYSKRVGLVKNVFSGFTAWLLTIFLGFVATPIIIKNLGNAEFGVYSLILGFVSYSFTFSIGRAITKYVSEYYATDQTGKISEVISATLWMNLLVGGIGAIVLAIFARGFVVGVLKVEIGLQEKAVTAFYFSAAIIFLTMLNQVFSSIIQALQRFDIFSYITTATNLLLTGGNILLVWFGWKIEALLAWNLILIFTATAVFYFAAKKILPQLRIVFSVPPEIIKLVIKYSSAVIATQLFGNLILLFERSWITRALGAEAVTFYVVPMNLALYIHAFVASLAMIIFPLASEADALENKEKLLTIYTKATKILIALIVFLCVTIIAGRNLILLRWVGESFVQNSSLTLVAHALTFSILAASIVAVQIIESIGFPSFTARLTLFWVCVSVPLMIFAAPFGILGISVSRLTGALIFIPAIFIIEKKVFQRNLGAFWRKLSVSLTPAVIFTALFETLTFEFLPATWSVLIAGTILGAASFGAALLISGFFTVKEKDWLVALIKTRLPGRI